MKKNRALRLAALMLVLVMMTSCFVGGTFAKYTTTTTGTDTARVAYWGFNAPAEMTIDLFDGEYQHVASATTDNVVAPGTSKEYAFGFAYSSNFKYDTPIKAPEVAYTLNVDADVTGSYAALDGNPNFKWTLNKPLEETTYYNTVAELVAAIEALDGNADGAKEYAAGDNSAPITRGNSYYIGWIWEFETVDSDGKADATQDAMDTAMGNNLDGLDNVSITITITATQID